MRKYKDKNGVEVRLYSIIGTNDFAGVLEGNPTMARKVRLKDAKSMMEAKGIYYWGLDQLENEINEEKVFPLPPRERWQAETGISNYLDRIGNFFRYEKKHLTLYWYAEGGDPMQMLGEILANIDFLELCKTTLVDERD